MPKSFTPIPKPSDEKDKKREARIYEEIVVDAYDDEEILSSWYHYLADTLEFPFEVYVRVDNPENSIMNILATVQAMADIRFCSVRNMWLQAHVKHSSWYFNVPMSEIVEAKAGKQTIQALSDWKYWIK
jgi:Calcium binding